MFNVLRKHSSDSKPGIVLDNVSKKEAIEFIATEVNYLTSDATTEHLVVADSNKAVVWFFSPCGDWIIGYWIEKAGA